MQWLARSMVEVTPDRLDVTEAPRARRGPFRPRKIKKRIVSTSRSASSGETRRTDPVFRGPTGVARPRSRSIAFEPPAGSSCVCRSAACTTKPRSVDTAARMSAPIRAGHREPQRPARKSVLLLDEVDKLGKDMTGGPRRRCSSSGPQQICVHRPLHRRSVDLTQIMFS